MMINPLLRRLVRRSSPILLATLPLAGCMSLSDYGEAPGYERGYPDYPREAAEWYGRDVGSVDGFYSALDRYGRWDLHPGYGRVFVPLGVGRSWQPYSQGYWATDPRYGRRWISAEPFGWATYHYGRWARDSRLGWFWVPDTRYGPGWVSWREGNGYSGWSPLPPFGWNRWSAGYGGYDPWGYDSWLFAPSAYLYRPGLNSHIVRGRPHYDRTRPVERPTTRPDRPNSPTPNPPAWSGRPDGEGREPGWRPRDDRPGRVAQDGVERPPRRDGATWNGRDGATRNGQDGATRNGQDGTTRSPDAARPDRPAYARSPESRARADRPVSNPASMTGIASRPARTVQAAPAQAPAISPQTAPARAPRAEPAARVSRVEASQPVQRDRSSTVRDELVRRQPE